MTHIPLAAAQRVELAISVADQRLDVRNACGLRLPRLKCVTRQPETQTLPASNAAQ